MSDKPDTAGSKFQVVCKAKGTDTELGYVFGVGMVSMVKNNAGVFEPFVDSQDDHIPDVEMLKASSKFMERSRTLKAMHEGQPIGEVVHSWPLTEEMAKAYDIETKQTMWMVAVKPANAADVAKFKSGEWTGFSIGGTGRRVVTAR